MVYLIIINIFYFYLHVCIDNGISDIGMNYLSETLYELKDLKELNISNNRISKYGIKYIVDHLSENHHNAMKTFICESIYI